MGEVTELAPKSGLSRSSSAPALLKKEEKFEKRSSAAIKTAKTKLASAKVLKQEGKNREERKAAVSVKKKNAKMKLAAMSALKKEGKERGRRALGEKRKKDRAVAFFKLLDALDKTVIAKEVDAQHEHNKRQIECREKYDNCRAKE